MENKNTLMEAILDLLNSDGSFSDILLESDAPIMIRTSKGWDQSKISEIPTMDSIGQFLEPIDPDWHDSIIRGAINRPFTLDPWRLRVNAYLAFGGKKLMVSIRRIPMKPPAFSQTGLPAATRLILESRSGIILISGATGSGKTTSMAAMVEVVNEIRNAHIITIEDPIEYVFERKNSIFSQREVGVDCESFDQGVKDAMRQRPDVIVIGEIRDRETAEQALLAGESGHLVIGTLHASSAAGTITKMLGFFNAQEREARLQSLASSLLGVINQVLIPRRGETGYALAVDFLANHKRQYSKILGDPDKVQSMITRREDGISMGLGDSVLKLISDGVVDIADVAGVISGNVTVYNKVREARKGSQEE